MTFITIAYAAVDEVAFGKVLDPIIRGIVYPLISFIFALAVLVFMWGVVKMIAFPKDAEAYDNGKRSILYGVIGMFIMLSAWGIVHLIADTVNSI